MEQVKTPIDVFEEVFEDFIDGGRRYTTLFRLDADFAELHGACVNLRLTNLINDREMDDYIGQLIEAKEVYKLHILKSEEI